MTDVGAHKHIPGDDYLYYAVAAAEMVANGEADRGVLICDPDPGWISWQTRCRACGPRWSTMRNWLG